MDWLRIAVHTSVTVMHISFKNIIEFFSRYSQKSYCIHLHQANRDDGSRLSWDTGHRTNESTDERSDKDGPREDKTPEECLDFLRDKLSSLIAMILLLSLQQSVY